MDPEQPIRLAYLTAGGAGMYCGSCMRDNAVVHGLRDHGFDAQLIPLYTPIRTDAEDWSIDRIFFGGINVWLQQHNPLFRWIPGFLDHWLDHPRLLKRVATGSVSVDAKELGAMTLSMARGEHGKQRKEVKRLVRWLRDHAQPDLIGLTNLLVAGSLPTIRRELPGVPVVVTLQGDDVFLDELQEPWREQVLTELRRLAADVDGFVVFNEGYREKMQALLGVDASKFHSASLGVEEAHFQGLAEDRAAPRGPDDRPRVIGYFARLCPEKGFDRLVDGFLDLARRPGFEDVQLHAAGWLSKKDEPFFGQQLARLEAAGLADRFHHAGSPDMQGKREFLAGLDVFSVPARFVEPKGIYVLEALASGVPVVLPDSGMFPELVTPSGGGLLVPPDDPTALADGWATLLQDPTTAHTMGQAGAQWVRASGGYTAMVRSTADVYRHLVTR